MRLAKRILPIILIMSMLSVALPVSAVADYRHSHHTDLALEAVTEGIVLLKNDDSALPLSSGERLALFGGGQIYTWSVESGYQIGGGGSGWVSSVKGTPKGPADALLDAEALGKVEIYKPLLEKYQSDVSYVPDAEMYASAAEFADTAIMFITRFSSEDADMSADDWNLSEDEAVMLKALSDSFENVVVILNTPSAMGTDWSFDENELGVNVNALLACYMGGEKGGEGMAEILTGGANPSGKLTHTYAKDIYDYPTTETFLENDDYVNYTEDVYVGYRYFETFAKDKVAYPFGHGLSYTDFEITSSSVAVVGEKISVNVTVKNTGEVAGKEVVQAYYSAPQAGTGEAKLSKASIVLACYEKTKLLEPGATQEITLSYAISDMASFDDTGKTGNGDCFVLEAGDYVILVGNSVRNTSEVGRYTLDEQVVVSEHKKLLETTLTERLTYNGTKESLPAKTVEVSEAEESEAEESAQTQIDLDADRYKGITYADVAAGKATVEALVSQMSYSELIGLCYGHEDGISDGTGTVGFASNKTAEKYGVYSADTADGPAGLRLSGGASVATFWPCSTLQASTWNTELLGRIGKAVGEECLRYNADIWLAPGLNIQRNPLCGRNFEYYSEDPVVSGKTAAAVVNGVQSTGVGCAIKHFAANGKETNRKRSDSRISEKALREIYLKGFEIAVKESEPVCVMSSYNLINGVYTSTSSELLGGILREEWGFEGLIVSDWESTPDNVSELMAGNNVKMPFTSGEPDAIKEAVMNGIVSRELLEQNAIYVINTLVRLPDHTVHLGYVNKISAEGVTTISADKYSKKAYMTKFDIVGDTLCASHTEYQDEIDGSRGFIEFTISVDVAGVYSCAMNYATISDIGDAYEILLNGESVALPDRNLTSTGAWGAFADKALGEIYLEEGISTVRIQHTSGTAANYHTLSLELLRAHEDCYGEWTAIDDNHHKRICECGREYVENHKWNDGEILKEATKTEEGSIKYTCTECGHTVNEVIPCIVINPLPKILAVSAISVGALSLVAAAVVVPTVIVKKRKL